MKLRLAFPLVLLAALSFRGPCAQAATNTVTSVDPERSRNGEPIRFTITIIHEGNDPVRPPRLPEMADFELVNSFPSTGRSITIDNGRVIAKFKGQFTFILKPLRAGKLTIPPAEYFIGGTLARTEAVDVTVDRLGVPVGQRSGPNVANPPPSSFFPGGGNATNNGRFEGVNPRESFFLRAETSKLDVYQSELITISYALYQKDVQIANPEIAKFPDFKGFLKEDLVAPKVFARERVELNGVPYYRSEIFRYAVFPLKAGKLSIDPMQFRADLIQDTMAMIQQQLLFGQVPQNMNNGVIPMTKQSQQIDVNAKPLPPTPPDTNFTGGVGQFQVEIKGPQGKLTADQPFSVTLTISGKGNVKSIEDPGLKLPASLEISGTPKPAYEFREDATGFKAFEYLVLPHQAGDLRIDPVKWTYFDPATGQYQTLSTEGLTLHIEGSSNAPVAGQTANPNGQTEAAPAFAAYREKAGHWVALTQIGERSFLGSRFIWIFEALAAASLALVFSRRRKDAFDEDRLRRAPWERTAREIRERLRKKVSAVEIAILVDQWTRERLAGILVETHAYLHGESTRDEYMDALRDRIHPEHHKILDQLKKLWTELDLLRFAAVQNPQAEGALLFERAQKTSNEIQKVIPE